MSERLVIIDGKSVFYRGYYAMPNLSTKDGKPTGGVYGFAVMALEVIKRLKPNYVCVAWDKRHTNIRLRLKQYPQYKGNRKPPPEDFYDQVEILLELLKSLDWPLYELDDYEADDIMATFATQAKAKGIETYLVTSDLDVLQLVNSHTHIYTLKKGLSNIEHFDVPYFEEKYGVGAHQWIDVKALKGDTSDNIPGVAGIGEKTALELIEKYHDLDGVYKNLALIKPAVQAKLEKDKDMAYLSKSLVTLYTDAPITLDLAAVKLQAAVPPAFVAMLRKLEFRTLLQQVEAAMSQDEIEAAEKSEDSLVPAKEVAFKPAVFATQTPRVVCMNPEASELWVSAKQGEYSVIALAEADKVLVGPLVGHDLKRVLRELLNAGQHPKAKVAHDTRITAFLLNSLHRTVDIGDLVGQTILADEAGKHIAAVWKLYDAQLTELHKIPTIKKVAEDFDFPMILLLAKMEHRGILLDVPYLAEMSQRFAKEIGIMERKIYAQAGQEFNIASPAQLGMILYEKLGLPTQGVKKGKTGAYSTGAAELDRLRPLHPIIDLITRYREYTKLKSTYIDALPKLVDDQGKLHTTFDLDVAATGRLSSHDPNLQNIPTRTEIGQAIRTAFVPAKGHVFVSADYNQFELRLSAEMAHDQDLIDSFNKDEDVHTRTAAELYNVPMDQVTKEMRRDAKTVNFGILYGMSPHGLSVATGMNLHEAKQFIDRYFEVRQPVREYINSTVQEALKVGYVETIFGRRRPTPDLKSSNFMVREGAKRAAQNMPIQGTEADIMKLAMLKVEDKLEGLGEQLLQIHDSILVETPAENADKVAVILKETMESIHPLNVQLKVDTTTGNNWGEL